MKKPLISIITPTYNRADLLSHAINSVINQKQDIPFDWEMLIVDDWSTDTTSQVVEEYIKKYPQNIKYFYQKNSWIPGVARNVWLDNMSSESTYVIFLDSDDELVDDCIQTCLYRWNMLLKENKYDHVDNIHFFMKGSDGSLVWSKSIFKNVKKYLTISYKDILANKFAFAFESMIKSKPFLENNLLRFDKQYISEAILWLIMSKESYERWCYDIFIDYTWYIYRRDHDWLQITKTIDTQRFRNNALWNAKALDIINKDLISFWYRHTYADYLFREGINWILYGEKKKWLALLKSSLRIQFSLKVFVLYVISLLSQNLILLLYKIESKI